GQAQPFLDLMEAVSRIAPLDRPVLVIGERGTGKELIAARLHFLSPRWDRPLVKLNAAALPETLLESELFGHEAGAFTGAVRRRAGRFELADSGSLFLDEIADTNLAVQERLLRVVEYGAFERLGGSVTVQVDVRLIGATNVDLPSEAAAGRFRDDLLDRLAFDVLTVPPLRARRDDVPLLADHFGRAMAHDLGWSDFPGFGRDAMQALLAHPWPGNVRELKNVVERAVYRAPRPDRVIGEVQFDPFDSPYRPAPRRTGSMPEAAIPPPSRPEPFPDEAPSALPDSTPAPRDFQAATAAYERALLEQALTRNRHHQRATAADLGLSYDQLRHQLRKHRLLPGDAASGAA
ncbi:MAG: phage shock protein operon transcriptional activator, partial [Geminicoccaceae bacterium]